MAPLPPPGADALAHSDRLRQLILEDVDRQDGWIPFSRFMELALYAPGMGYYTAGSRKFGRVVARQAAQVMSLSAPVITELGAGSGKLAAEILLELERLGQLPERYCILDLSADLRERQQTLLQQRAPHLLPRVSWLDTLPDDIEGMVVGNEVLDAMPVHLVRWGRDGIAERGVVADGESFAWRERPARSPGLEEAATRIAVPEGYLSEISLSARGMTRSLCERLRNGVALFVDYGFGAREYYHPQRNEGTLMCHYRHHAHADPFFLVGLQDITTHVDFSATLESAAEGGAHLLGYTTQAHFLLNAGILEFLQQASPGDPGAYLPLASQLQQLTSPAEMGELFKVIALGKGVTAPLSGFARGDLSRLL